MATSSRSRRALEARSGGKIVRARRTAGPRTPYDRPRLTNPEAENANWISKLIFSPTRAIASGAGKLISTVFSQDDDDSSSSSSSESDSSSEENDANYDEDDDDISSHGAELNQRNGKSEIIKVFRKDLEPTMGKKDFKCAIEELLMQQTFTREEGNKLIKIIKARVVDGFSIKGAEMGGLIEIPGETSGEADKQVLRCTAVMEAKKWLSEKKLKSVSKSDVNDVIGDEAGSPVDMAKVYMRTRPLWASPTLKHEEFSSPSPIGTHLFKEETPYSIGGNTLSLSKTKKETPTTGSWNIQEEIHRVRVKATEEMLRNLPSKNIDWSSRASPISLLAKNIDANIGEKWGASLPTTTGLCGTLRFQGMEIASDGLRNETSLLEGVDITSEQNQDLEATNIVDGEGGTKDGLEVTVCKEHGLQSSQDTETQTSLSDVGVNVVCNHKDTSATEKQLSPIAEGSIQVPDPRSLESNCTTSKEVAGNESAHTSNGLPPSGYSLSTEAVSKQDTLLDGEEHDPVGSGYDKTDGGVFEDESCELLSEASVEIPYVSNDAMNENDQITNGSPNVAQRYSTRQGLKRSLAPNATGDVEKQQGKRPSKYNRKKQGISTQ